MSFTKCSECEHHGHDGRNPEFMGNCAECIHNPNYTDYFTKKVK